MNMCANRGSGVRCQVSGFRGSRVERFKGLEVQGLRGSKVQRFRGSRVQGKVMNDEYRPG